MTEAVMTFPWMRGVLAAAGVLAVTACSDLMGGSDPSTVEVQLYVDHDYSGSITAGDFAPPYITVALVADSGAAPAAEGLTDEQGIVHLEVAPGTYTVVVTGLGGETTRMDPAQATVRAPRKGARLQVLLRFFVLPGTLSGFAYRDDNLNNRRDAGEPGAAGASVKVY